jgi:Nidogen-like
VFIQVGIDAGDNSNYYAVPWTMKNAVINLAQYSNTDLKGRWLFRIDQRPVQLPSYSTIAGQLTKKAVARWASSDLSKEFSKRND